MNSPIINDVECHGNTVFVKIPDIPEPCPTGLGRRTEAHVFDWTHPKGDRTLLIIGLEERFEHVGYEVRVYDSGEWHQHETGSVQGEAFRTYEVDGDFDVEGFESRLGEALA